MIKSDSGRTEGAEFRYRRPRLRTVSLETEDGGMSKPHPLFALVDTEFLEALANTTGNDHAAISFVVEDDHSDATGLAIPLWRERRWWPAIASCLENSGDRAHLLQRAMAEKCERDVEILAGDEPHIVEIAQLRCLPGDQRSQGFFRQRETHEKSDALIR